MSFFYTPFGWILSFFYNLVSNYGVALILFTIFTRLLMLPLSIHQQKGTAKQSRITAKAAKIRQRYAGDQQRINQETQAMYDREGFNPMSAGCLPLLIQFPIMMGLYGVIYKPLTYVLNIPEQAITTLKDVLQKLLGEEFTGRAAQHYELSIINKINDIATQNPQVGVDVLDKIKNFDFTFLGLNMAEVPNLKEPNILWLIPILSGVTSLLTSLVTFIRQRKASQGQEQQNALMMGCMSFGMPLFSVYLAFNFPVGIGIYWVMSNVFAFFQTLVLGHIYSPEKIVAKSMVQETIQKRAYEKVIKSAETSDKTDQRGLSEEFRK